MPDFHSPLLELCRVADVIVEDATALAARVEVEPSWSTVVGLMAAGRDLAAISAAMAVCLRRADTPEDEPPYPRGL
jgi:hypothetical protein